MDSYERIKLTLMHKEPDRIPFDLGGTVLTGMNISTYRRLRDYLGMPAKEARILDPTQQLAVIDEDIIDRLCVDVRCVDPSAPLGATNAKAISENATHYEMTDEWGIGWKMPKNGGHYFDMVSHPLANTFEIDELGAYAWPDSLDDARFTTMKQRADEYVFNQKRAYVLGRHSAGIWEMALWTSGFEKFFCDMLSDEAYACALMEKITDLKMQYWGKALDAVGKNVLIVSEADDLATQISTLISPELYKRMVSPYHKKLFDFMRKRAKAPIHIFYHSCGAVKELIPCLIEEGVDILNPVQVSAKGMDTKELKKEFGRDITFWGGGIDTQHILPYGSVQDVKDEVRHRIDDLRKDGGFVFNTVHNVQSDVPAENYMAMWETLMEYGRY